MADKNVCPTIKVSDLPKTKTPGVLKAGREKSFLSKDATAHRPNRVVNVVVVSSSTSFIALKS
jgi:hypothetical protein